ncbi:MAG TPA: acetyl-CoA carboxylase biotin carboxyl carrier protein [Phycisphaerae bacterium]|nr:acetyl-CoA carboxylase biotin carboxyl carrier protein [Phycisphaerae bacterium]
MAKKPSQKPVPGSQDPGFTDTKRVKDLIALMTENGLSEIELVEDKSRILLRRGVSGGAAAPMPMHHAPVAAHMPAAQVSEAAPKAAAADDKSVPIKSPMVGTFYSAPSPDASPYVSVGTSVDDKSVVCIIEAMKVFNPIHAEVRGTVVKVLVSNGQVVEYGQPLFLVKPD